MALLRSPRQYRARLLSWNCRRRTRSGRRGRQCIGMKWYEDAGADGGAGAPGQWPAARFSPESDDGEALRPPRAHIINSVGFHARVGVNQGDPGSRRLTRSPGSAAASRRRPRRRLPPEDDLAGVHLTEGPNSRRKRRRRLGVHLTHFTRRMWSTMTTSTPCRAPAVRRRRGRRRADRWPSQPTSDRAHGANRTTGLSDNNTRSSSTRFLQSVLCVITRPSTSGRSS